MKNFVVFAKIQTFEIKQKSVILINVNSENLDSRLMNPPTVNHIMVDYLKLLDIAYSLA